MDRRLILNLGSRRLAWRGPDGHGSFVHDGVPGRRLLAELAGRPAPAEVVLGSVAAEAVTAELAAACRSVWGVEPRRLLARREACGVRNGYARPETLGIDRWAGVVAAYVAWGGGFLLADCGTATTLDFVDAQGRHRGGLIAPGAELMRRALAAGTRLELVAAEVPVPELLGADTQSAVAGGVRESIAGLLETMAGRIEAAYGGPLRLVVTGGAAAGLGARLGPAWQQAPDIVLDGLDLLARQGGR